MVIKQFYYTRRLYINHWQKTRDEERVYSKINIRGQFSVELEGSTLTGFLETRSKTTFISSKTFKIRVIELWILGNFTGRIQVNRSCRFCNTVFAVLVQVKCVKLSSENETLR